MIKCDLKLGQYGRARARYDRLMKQFDSAKGIYYTLGGLLREAELSEEQFLATTPEPIEAPAAWIDEASDAAAAEATNDPPAARELLALMHRHWTEKFGPNEMKAAVARIGDDADAVIGPMLRDFWAEGTSLAFRHRTVWALAAIGTPTARAQLRKLALGASTAMDLRPFSRAAADRYIDTATDMAQIVPLLGAADKVVAVRAAIGLRGAALDEPSIRRIIQVIGMDHEMPFEIANLCRTLYFDPSGRLADEKIAVTLEAIERIAAHPRAGEIAWPGSQTQAEWATWYIAQSLAELKDARQVLARAAAKIDGRPSPAAQRVFTVARGLAGDASVRQSVASILVDETAGRAREWAAHALGEVGTPQDVALLSKVQADDPLQCKRGGCLAPMNDELYYPVREAAARAIQRINERHAVGA
jgi:HEAT repeat protein